MGSVILDLVYKLIPIKVQEDFWSCSHTDLKVLCLLLPKVSTWWTSIWDEDRVEVVAVQPLSVLNLKPLQMILKSQIRGSHCSGLLLETSVDLGA